MTISPPELLPILFSGPSGKPVEATTLLMQMVFKKRKLTPPVPSPATGV